MSQKTLYEDLMSAAECVHMIKLIREEVEQLKKENAMLKALYLEREGERQPNYIIPVDAQPITDASAQTRRAFSLKEAAGFCGRGYHTLRRAVLRGELRPLKGFGRLMVSEAEVNRFLSRTREYIPRKRKAPVARRSSKGSFQE